MTEFLLKSGVSMGILLAVYYLLLEREKMHRFNRLFLLVSLVFSLALPLITIPVYVAAQTVPEVVDSGPAAINSTVAPIVQQSVNYRPFILWPLYGLGAALLLVRFTCNLLSFKQKINAGNVTAYENAKLVLVKEEILPHTFLNYIFINEKEYEARTIEKELFTHELTHVRQKHTLDILFIEILKIIFWFNPLLYL